MCPRCIQLHDELQRSETSIRVLEMSIRRVGGSIHATSTATPEIDAKCQCATLTQTLNHQNKTISSLEHELGRARAATATTTTITSNEDRFAIFHSRSILRKFEGKDYPF